MTISATKLVATGILPVAIGDLGLGRGVERRGQMSRASSSGLK